MPLFERPQMRGRELERRKAHPVRAVFSDIGFYAKSTGIAIKDALKWSDPDDRDMRQRFMPREVRRDRRRFLLLAGAAAIVAVAGGVSRAVDTVATDFTDESKMSDDTIPALKAAVDDLLNEDIDFFKPGEIIPEDERTGANIMVGINPESKLVSARDLPNAVSERYGSLFKSLAEGTAVKIVIPEGIESDIEEIQSDYPHLSISLYELPFSPEGNDYMQDVVFASGSQDDQGRFLIGTSRADVKLTSSNLRKYEYDVQGRALLDTHLICDESLRTASTRGVQFIGDDLIVDKYPADFSRKMVVPPLRGGDLSVTRLPDGKMAALVGRHVLMNFFDSVYSLGSDKWMNPDYFWKRVASAKKKYAKALGVDEVIIPGERHMNEYKGSNGMIAYKKMLMESLSGETPKDFPFFHIDMAVKTATSHRGESLSFCTSVQGREDYSQGVRTYLNEVKSQFDKLGFRVVPLPCGPYAAMNYTNCLMFTNSDNEKVVMLPQYGIDEDEEAANIYKSEGFKVVPIDMTDTMQLSGETGYREGSLHCRAVVLN
ncbi:hypothetical protein HN709_01705 [Candidatus Peregrinibacteria bacterium]|nr:hypothetical protein [Candidatus Peregrinibacteria bacterium]MBT7736378.1 hypothetical protein [Candidatus Peregrinibacteria bacterium]